MYNFLVTSSIGAWDHGTYEWDKGRILEYTEQSISDALSKLSQSELDTMMLYPCIFAYEGTKHAMRLGRITKARVRSSSVVIEFQFEDGAPEIDFLTASRIFGYLDIRKWEINRTHWAVKDADLYDVLREREILPEGFAPQFVARRNALPKTVDLSVPIEKLQDFIGAVLADGRGQKTELFYRGHSKKKYRLEPSLFRKDDAGNFLYLPNEHLIYRELLVSNSADFAGDTTTLDKLVRMQHYSMPTRLLDITSNPLIALYFACASSNEEIGEVIAFEIDQKSIKYFDSDTASCIANLETV